jgi:hypothetical protein
LRRKYRRGCRGPSIGGVSACIPFVASGAAMGFARLGCQLTAERFAHPTPAGALHALCASRCLWPLPAHGSHAFRAAGPEPRYSNVRRSSAVGTAAMRPKSLRGQDDIGTTATLTWFVYSPYDSDRE